MNAGPEVAVFATAELLYRAAADAFIREAAVNVAKRGFCTIALSGGNTPKPIHAHVAADSSVDWDRVHVFWSDERGVPPEHEDSNYRMAVETLLSKVPVPASNVHRIHAEDADLQNAASRYEDEIRAFFAVPSENVPGFDVVLLGMGADAHTASLFPGCQILGSTSPGDRLVAVTQGPAPVSSRITLTPLAINHAGYVMFVVTGRAKAEALKAVLQGPHDPQRWPAQAIRPTAGRLVFMADAAAAQLLSP